MRQAPAPGPRPVFPPAGVPDMRRPGRALARYCHAWPATGSVASRPDIARRFDLICVENLQIRNMTRPAGGTVEQPGRDVRQKAGRWPASVTSSSDNGGLEPRTGSSASRRWQSSGGDIGSPRGSSGERQRDQPDVLVDRPAPATQVTAASRLSTTGTPSPSRCSRACPANSPAWYKTHRTPDSCAASASSTLSPTTATLSGRTSRRARWRVRSGALQPAGEPWVPSTRLKKSAIPCWTTCRTRLSCGCIDSSDWCPPAALHLASASAAPWFSGAVSSRRE